MLGETFGKADDGRPNWRLALTNQTEKRAGVFEDWYDHIFIRREFGVREQPKYNYNGYHEKPHWALEHLIFAPMPDLVNSEGGATYEPMHVFPHIDGSCQLPPWRGIELIIYALLYGPKKTKDEYMAEDEKAFQKEVELFQLLMEEDYGQPISEADGMAMPKQYEGESPAMKAPLILPG